MGTRDDTGDMGRPKAGNDIAKWPSGDRKRLEFDGGPGLAKMGGNVIGAAGQMVWMLKIAGAEIAGKFLDVNAQATGINEVPGPCIPVAGWLG